MTQVTSCFLGYSVWAFFPFYCRKMLKLCGETEDKLAQELIHFELQVERDVIEPLFLLAEVRSGMRLGLSEQKGTVQWALQSFCSSLITVSTLTLLCDTVFYQGLLPLNCMVRIPHYVCCPLLPPVLLSIGIPVEKGVKVAALLLSPPGSPLPSPPLSSTHLKSSVK